jgi:arsenite methyltransferase
LSGENNIKKQWKGEEEMPDRNQSQTAEVFGFKWTLRDTYESYHMKKKLREWLVRKYFGNEKVKDQAVKNFKGKAILDAGCGSSMSALLLLEDVINDMYYLGVDISDSVDVARQRFAEKKIKGNFLKSDIAAMKLQRKFDIIFSEGVIHHTSKPFETFKNLVYHLQENGKIMFYVYKKKAPVREFCDDFIRDKIKPLSNKDAWKKLLPLTKLGKKLGDCNQEIEIEEDIELLEIPRGKYNLQRLFYYYIMKIYYDKNFTIAEMNHINFDWYRPLNCYRFEPGEIKDWLKACNLKEERFVVEDSGITVIARKET